MRAPVGDGSDDLLYGPFKEEELIVIRQALDEFGRKNCCGSKNQTARHLISRFPLRAQDERRRQLLHAATNVRGI